MDEQRQEKRDSKGKPIVKDGNLCYTCIKQGDCKIESSLKYGYGAITCIYHETLAEVKEDLVWQIEAGYGKIAVAAKKCMNEIAAKAVELAEEIYRKNALLEELEWAGNRTRTGHNTCPSCGYVFKPGSDNHSHADNCELAKELYGEEMT